jgi:plasmid stability protein
MKNITISMDDDLARATRIEAAKAGKSMSKYIAELLRQHMNSGRAHRDGSERNPQMEALETFLSGPALHIAVDGKMPTAEERNRR